MLIHIRVKVYTKRDVDTSNDTNESTPECDHDALQQQVQASKYFKSVSHKCRQRTSYSVLKLG